MKGCVLTIPAMLTLLLNAQAQKCFLNFTTDATAHRALVIPTKRAPPDYSHNWQLALGFQSSIASATANELRSVNQRILNQRSSGFPYDCPYPRYSWSIPHSLGSNFSYHRWGHPTNQAIHDVRDSEVKRKCHLLRLWGGESCLHASTASVCALKISYRSEPWRFLCKAFSSLNKGVKHFPV